MDDNLTNMIAMAEKDFQIFELKRKLRAIPGQLADARKQLDAEDKILAEHEGPWSALEGSIREKEATIQVALETIDKFEAHMKLVQTQKEYMAAKKQVDDARKLNDQLQEDILQARVQQEEMSEKLNEVRERHQRVKETYEDTERTILTAKAQTEQQIEALEAELAKHAAHVDDNMMRYYKRLTGAGKLPAIVRVDSGTCTGCRMTLPPQDYNQLIANPGQFRTCSNCQRVVYYLPPEASDDGDAAETDASQPDAVVADAGASAAVSDEPAPSKASA